MAVVVIPAYSSGLFHAGRGNTRDEQYHPRDAGADHARTCISGKADNGVHTVHGELACAE